MCSFGKEMLYEQLIKKIKKNLNIIEVGIMKEIFV